jgi:hypothetical protein
LVEITKHYLDLDDEHLDDKAHCLVSGGSLP